MEIKITVQLKPQELQVIQEALLNYGRDLANGESVAIIGVDPITCRSMVNELLITIGMVERTPAGSYAVQQALFKQ